METILAKIRRALFIHIGDDGIRQVHQKFHVLGQNPQSIICMDNLITGLECFGLFMEVPEYNQMASVFAAEGGVDVSQFCGALREGALNDSRRSNVWEAFSSLGGSTYVPTDVFEMRKRFRANQHPKVLSGEKTTQEATDDFMNTFSPKSNPDGFVTWPEFEAYYAGVSEGVDHDEFFQLLLSTTWNLDSATADSGSMRFEAAAMSNIRKSLPPGALSVAKVTKRQPPKRVVGYAGHIPGAMDMLGVTFDVSERFSTVPPKKEKLPEAPPGHDICQKEMFRGRAINGNLHTYKLE